jgi:hypothetical protein
MKISFMRVRNHTSRVEQKAGGGGWPVLLWLLFPLAVFAAPSAPRYSITDFVTCENARTNAPHDWHVPQAVFQTDANNFFAWVELKDVSGEHPVEMKLYRPDGTYFGEEKQAVIETNGIASWWRMVARWGIKGKALAQTPGIWKLDLVIDGARQRSILLNISSGNPVLAAAGQPGFTNSVVRAQTTSSPAPVNQDARECIIWASSDLRHWTPIQTNALPSGAVPDLASGRGGFRLKVRGPGVQSCVIEASLDSMNWMPIQTNDLPRQSSLDTSDGGVVTARFYRTVIR